VPYLLAIAAISNRQQTLPLQKRNVFSVGDRRAVCDLHQHKNAPPLLADRTRTDKHSSLSFLFSLCHPFLEIADIIKITLFVRYVNGKQRYF